MEHVRNVIRYLGLRLDETQEHLLETYAIWLATEGIRAGGIGPDERDRIERRHIADSLLFSVGIPVGTSEVWDLGTGVGLPGIPLAVAHRETSFVLIDRSAKRVDLLRRFVRIADLHNCEVVKAEIEEMEGDSPVIVTRASLPPSRLETVARRLLKSGGVMIVGGSWVTRPDEAGWEIEEIPRYVLDQPVWLLMMRPA